jgi:hypothetical protein
MRKTQVTLPELALIAGTRGILGAGIGLLLADRLPQAQRRAVGWTLLTFGLLTTIPLAIEVISEIQPAESANPQGFSRDQARAYAG